MNRSVDAFRHLVQEYLPNSFTIALLLTLFSLVLGVVLTPHSLPGMIGFWYGGFWEFLTFAMQMVLILLTGYCLAVSPPVMTVMKFLARRIDTTRAALGATVLVSGVATYLSWGLGFVIGPLFVLEIARRTDVNFPYLVAAAYTTAMAVLPAGLTITAPILLNTPGHFLEEEVGLIPLSETIFGSTLMGTALMLLAGNYLLFLFMKPDHESRSHRVPDADHGKAMGKGNAVSGGSRFAQRLNRSRLLTLLMFLIGAVAVGQWFSEQGFNLTLNILNFTFIVVGMLLHGNPENYFQAMKEGTDSASGIILQFPFYAGIMGIMASSGMIVIMAESIVQFATPSTVGLFSMLSAGLVNIFVPSAGGQWGVQGPILVEVAQQLNVRVAVVVNGFTLGDLWTNLVQPFFALPALGITGLQLRDIWGYCLVFFLVYGMIGCLGLIAFQGVF